MIAALCVALKQHYGESKLQVGPVEVQFTFLPLLVWLFGFTLRVVGDYNTLINATLGVLIAWLYLRFFERKSTGRGDGRPEFSFASFFPFVLRPPIERAAVVMFALLHTMHCCPAFGLLDLSAPSEARPSAAPASLAHSAAPPVLSSVAVRPGEAELESEREEKRARMLRAIALQMVEEGLGTQREQDPV